MSLNIPKKNIAVTDNDDDNDWQIPDGLVESLQQSAARRKEKLLITREMLDNFTDWISEAQQLRKTLTDLITSLQEVHVRYPYALSDGFFCDTCQKDWPCPTVQAVDAAVHS